MTTSTSTSTDADADLLLALLGDARLPVGGHAHSAGLEAALLDGLPPDQVPALCRTRLRTVVRVEGGTALAARAAVLAGTSLAPVEAAWAARTPSAPLRAASRRLGRGYARLADRLFPGTLLPPPRRDGWCRPVVVGHLAAHAGLDPRRAALVCAYDDVQTVTAAALKLEPGDPVAATATLWALRADVAALADDVTDVATPDLVPAAAAPHLDALSLVHATRKQRLFHA